MRLDTGKRSWNAVKIEKSGNIWQTIFDALLQINELQPDCGLCLKSAATPVRAAVRKRHNPLPLSFTSVNKLEKQRLRAKRAGPDLHAAALKLSSVYANGALKTRAVERDERARTWNRWSKQGRLYRGADHAVVRVRCMASEEKRQ